MDFPLNGHSYEPRQLLGQGAFGRVFECTDTVTGSLCAVKVISKREYSVDLEAVSKEARILAGISHPHIVEFRRAMELSDSLLIEMELMAGGSLKEVIALKRLCDEDCALVLRQVLEAVVYLHGRDIVHRDLKPDNILFKAPGSYQHAKITDFGLSEKFEDKVWGQSMRGSCGTLAFMAPEQAASQPYARPVDVWSCAIILYMLVAGRHPLLEPEDDAQSYLLKLKNPQWEFPELFPSLARDLFLRMACPKAINRYSAEEALRHPWISRQQTDIPLTYIERLNRFNLASRLRLLFLKTCAVAVWCRDPVKLALYHSQVVASSAPPQPKTQLKVVVSRVGPTHRRSGSFSLAKAAKSANSTPEHSPVTLKPRGSFGRLGVSPVSSPKRSGSQATFRP